MSVQSIRPFKAVPKDAAANFHGMQVVYFCWDKHLMFYAPVAKMLPPTLTFQQVIDSELTPTYSRHPDFAKIDWAAVQWRVITSYSIHYTKLYERWMPHSRRRCMRTSWR